MTSVTLLKLGLFLFLFLAPVFAAVCGRTAERLGAGICLSGMMITWGAQALLADAPVGAFMSVDLAMSVAFAALAVRYPEKLWPGLAASAQFLLFIFSATRAINYPLSQSAYLLALNISGICVALSLTAGAVLERWPALRIRDAEQDAWTEFNPAS